jgi:hypothetical protein
MSERLSAEVLALSGERLQQELDDGKALVARAARRREWDPDTHAPEAVLALLAGSVMHRALVERQPLTPEWISTVVDVVARGVSPGG